MRYRLIVYRMVTVREEWTVEADSHEHAREAFLDGAGDFEGEETVDTVGDPDVVEITNLTRPEDPDLTMDEGL